jgi:Fe2+ transport system protein B
VNIALIGGFAAKEVVIGAMATVYAHGGGVARHGRLPLRPPPRGPGGPPCAPSP